MSARRRVWIFVTLVVAFGVATMIAAWGLRGDKRPGEPSVLVFDLPEVLTETPPASFPFALQFARHGGLTVHEVVSALDRAARDPQIAALHLRVDRVDWGWAKLAEVRDAVQRFAATGKPVVATFIGGGDTEYFLATAAGTIAAPPSAILQVDGLAMSAIFYADLLAKLDIRANFARSGRYKSGIEPYTRSDMSGPSRAALEALLDDQYRLFIDSLAIARDFTSAEMRDLVDDGPWNAEDAFESGLVDTLLHNADAEKLADGDRSLQTLAFENYAAQHPRRSGPRIALIAASGTIVTGRSRFLGGGEEGLGTETLTNAIDDARDRGAKAIVLRIDSPGGEYGAADEMWHAVHRCAEEIPVIVSMSDLAASGGYLIAAPATRIVAQPSTITGSIGIYGGKLNLVGLYHKLGLDIETVQRGAQAGMMSPFTDFTPAEAERFQAHLDRDYRDLVTQVADGRGMSFDAVDSLGQGRVWSGQAAFENGLVDTLGGMDVALALALREAGLQENAPYVLDIYPRVHRTWLEKLITGWLDESVTSEAALPWSRLEIPSLDAWWKGSPLALLPFKVRLR